MSCKMTWDLSRLTVNLKPELSVYYRYSRIRHLGMRTFTSSLHEIINPFCFGKGF